MDIHPIETERNNERPHSPEQRQIESDGGGRADDDGV
jgi:hypothetical protein